MQDLLNYLYEPSMTVSLLLNVSVCSISLVILIGFVAARKKVKANFFIGWLVSLAISSCMLAYSVNEMNKESNFEALRKSAEISKQGNDLIISSKSQIVKTAKIAIEDETDTSIYVKIKDRYVKIAKSDLSALR